MNNGISDYNLSGPPGTTGIPGSILDIEYEIDTVLFYKTLNILFNINREELFNLFKKNKLNISVSSFIREVNKMNITDMDDLKFDDLNSIIKKLRREWKINKLLS